MGQSLRDMRRSSDRQPARSVGRRLLRQSLRHHQRAMIYVKAMLPRSDASTITAACRCAELSHVVRELSVRRATESQLKEPSSSTDLRQLRSATFKLSQGGLEQVRLNGKAPECRPRDRAWLERHAPPSTIHQRRRPTYSQLGASRPSPYGQRVVLCLQLPAVIATCSWLSLLPQ